MNSHVLMLQVLLEEHGMISTDKHGMQIADASAGGGLELWRRARSPKHTARDSDQHETQYKRPTSSTSERFSFIWMKTEWYWSTFLLNSTILSVSCSPLKGVVHHKTETLSLLIHLILFLISLDFVLGDLLEQVLMLECLKKSYFTLLQNALRHVS